MASVWDLIRGRANVNDFVEQPVQTDQWPQAVLDKMVYDSGPQGDLAMQQAVEPEYGMPMEPQVTQMPQLPAGNAGSPGYNSAISEYMKAMAEAQGLQKEGIGSLQERIKALQQVPERKDGLQQAVIMAADMWGGGGGKFGQAYNEANPELDPKQRQAAITQLEDTLRKSRGDLSDSQIAALKAKLGFEEAKIKAGQKEAVDEGNVLKTKESQTLQASNNFQNSLGKYQNLIDQYGVKMTGEGRKKLDSAYADLKIKYKEAANLGALTGPDMEIIMEAIAPATGFSGVFGETFKGGVDGIKGSLSQLGKRSRIDAQTQLDMLKAAYPGSKVASELEAKLNRFGAPAKNNVPPDMVAAAKAEQARRAAARGVQ